MSDEETIKRIEETLKLTELCQRTTNAPKISENYIWDMRTLLDLYNKEKEEKEKFKKALGKRITYCNEIEKDLFENCSNYVISKDKIKEKLEEYKNMLDNLNKKTDIDRIKAINERIIVLKEILGE